MNESEMKYMHASMHIPHTHTHGFDTKLGKEQSKNYHIV
jgi:hypothetical protein